MGNHEKGDRFPAGISRRSASASIVVNRSDRNGALSIVAATTGNIALAAAVGLYLTPTTTLPPRNRPRKIVNGLHEFRIGKGIGRKELGQPEIVMVLFEGFLKS